MKSILHFFMLIMILATACKQRSKSPALHVEKYNFPFNLNYPSKTLELGKKLKEISGLTHDDMDQLWCINDEKALLFSLDTLGKIVQSIDFGKNDDYEGLSYGKGLMYITENNGNIKIINLKTEEKINEYNTVLKKKNDIEGLYYYEKGNALLMASKSETKKGNIKIYKFDLEKNEISDDAMFTIDITNAVDSLETINTVDHFFVNLTLDARIKQFAPSGIAQDPYTDFFYILSSRGKLLVVIDEKGRVQYIQLLSKKLFGQPEGISFDSKGNLYISNEAKSTRANIQIFNRQDSILDEVKITSLIEQIFDTDTLKSDTLIHRSDKPTTTYQNKERN